MDISYEGRAEKNYIERENNVRKGLGYPVHKWVGNFKNKGLPDSGWTTVQCILDDSKSYNCDRCGYPNLANPVLIEHPDAGKVVVGPHCASEAQKHPLSI